MLVFVVTFPCHITLKVKIAKKKKNMVIVNVVTSHVHFQVKLFRLTIYSNNGS